MRRATHALAAMLGLLMAACASQATIETSETTPAPNETAVVDSVFAEDISIFPDTSVSEALQRIPGVEINRFAEESVVVTGVRGALQSSIDAKQGPPPAPEQRVPSPSLSAPPTPSPTPVQVSPPPGAVNTERYEAAETNPVRQAALEPVSTFSIDVDTAAYSNVRRMLSEGRLPPRDAVRTEELINYFDYGYEGPRDRSRPFATHVALAPSPWADGRYLMHIGLQGYDIAPSQRPPLNLVLLIDVSGSMQPANKLPLAIEGFRMLTEHLTARDHVAIVVYAGAAGEVLPPTRGDNQAAIQDALNRLRAGGSTAGGEGLALAYRLAERNFQRDAVNRVILATDGDFNVGVVDTGSLETFVSRKRESGVYLSVLGFGGGNYNDALMQTLAQNGNGVAAYIDSIAEARRVLNDDVAANLFPIANDVKIQVEFNPARVAEYRLIGYETRMLRREDFNNDRIDAGEINSGHAVTAIYEITPVGGPVSVDPLRYGANTRRAPATSEEFALLRIRYKLPGQSESRLIERPIVQRDMARNLASAPEATRWAAAVAAYGQMLRGDPYLREGYAWRDVIALAEGARGADANGQRAEFLRLAHNASSASAVVAERN